MKESCIKCGNSTPKELMSVTDYKYGNGKYVIPGKKRGIYIFSPIINEKREIVEEEWEFLCFHRDYNMERIIEYIKPKCYRDNNDNCVYYNTIKICHVNDYSKERLKKEITRNLMFLERDIEGFEYVSQPFVVMCIEECEERVIDI
jgi:hypothetical protein